MVGGKPFHPHSIDEETETQMLGDLSEVTKLVRTGLDWNCHPGDPDR